MHEDDCRPVVGQRNSTCAFCFCESSWKASDIPVCWACARAIIVEHWNTQVNPEPCARTQDYTRYPEED